MTVKKICVFTVCRRRGLQESFPSSRSAEKRKLCSSNCVLAHGFA